jgi:hypothetical protein
VKLDTELLLQLLISSAALAPHLSGRRLSRAFAIVRKAAYDQVRSRAEREKPVWQGVSGLWVFEVGLEVGNS